jgi:lysophospholipase L1-like esterase
MRVLILSDSHGRKMGSYLRNLDEDIEVQTLSLGQQLPAIRGYYRSELSNIRRKTPDIVVLHMGHNDLSKSERHNPEPLFITAVFHQVLEFVAEISHDLPNARIYISSMLPRVPSDEMGVLATGRYNKMAFRFYKIVRSDGNQEGSIFRSLLNRNMWGRINNSEPLRGLHLADGLHLNDAGLRVMAVGWIQGFKAK